MARLTAVRTTDEGIYVPIEPIYEYPSVQRAVQSKRIRRDPVLSDVATSMSIIDIQSVSLARRHHFPFHYSSTE